MSRRLAYKGSTLAADIMHWLWDELTATQPERPYVEFKTKRGIHYKAYSDTIYRLQKQGRIKVSVVAGKKFLTLTEQGQLETLLLQSVLPHPAAWDGKWRMIIFDIPEEARSQRDKLRRLLRDYGYRKLQASVFVYPFALHRAAVQYLRASGLMTYIRILRIDDMDDDTDLRKIFNLPKK